MSLSNPAAASSYTFEATNTNYISVCGICLSTYEIPKALPCLHSFCLECIREWVRISQKGRKIKSWDTISITCPTCSKACTLQYNGINGLPTNFFITERNSKEPMPTCSSCDKDDRDAVARCYECGLICKECLQPHEFMRALKVHNVIKLDKLRVGKTASGRKKGQQPL